jgi:fused signal recognition particle receptor
MLNLIKTAFSKIYSAVTSPLVSLLSRKSIDESTLTELEILLLAADTGVVTTRSIINSLRIAWSNGQITQGSELRHALQRHLLVLLSNANDPDYTSSIDLIVGINGSGKTTCAGKLAHYYSTQNKRVLLIAADTFRAAAGKQLQAWAQLAGCTLIEGTPGQDPAAVVFKGCEEFKSGTYDNLIIDTAGRLHTRVNLMNELEKIRRTITKQLPGHTINTLLTIDAMLGQNSFEQARIFKESTQVNGIILTKMDGTGKGGIVFAITQEFGIPVTYITFGEQAHQIEQFNSSDYVHDLLNT